MSSIENTSRYYLYCLFDNYCIMVKTLFIYCCLSMLLSVYIHNILLVGHSSLHISYCIIKIKYRHCTTIMFVPLLIMFKNYKTEHLTQKVKNQA